MALLTHHCHSAGDLCHMIHGKSIILTGFNSKNNRSTESHQGGMISACVKEEPKNNQSI